MPSRQARSRLIVFPASVRTPFPPAFFRHAPQRARGPRSVSALPVLRVYDGAPGFSTEGDFRGFRLTRAFDTLQRTLARCVEALLPDWLRWHAGIRDFFLGRPL